MCCLLLTKTTPRGLRTRVHLQAVTQETAPAAVPLPESSHQRTCCNVAHLKDTLFLTPSFSSSYYPISLYPWSYQYLLSSTALFFCTQYNITIKHNVMVTKVHQIARGQFSDRKLLDLLRIGQNLGLLRHFCTWLPGLLMPPWFLVSGSLPTASPGAKPWRPPGLSP